ncbi:MAG: helix-turn-helix domain-containing protein [Candidatus Hodarchaeota archaeon]
MADKTNLENYPLSKDFLSPIQFNLIKTLKDEGPLTRRDLVKELKIARTTIYDNLIKLQKRKLIEKFSRNDGKRGRPLIFWKFKD